MQFFPLKSNKEVAQNGNTIEFCCVELQQMFLSTTNSNKSPVLFFLMASTLFPFFKFNILFITYKSIFRKHTGTTGCSKTDIILPTIKPQLNCTLLNAAPCWYYMPYCLLSKKKKKKSQYCEILISLLQAILSATTLYKLLDGSVNDKLT